MDIGQYGDLNTLHWVENELDPEPNMVLCEVLYGELVIQHSAFLKPAPDFAGASILVY